jgi:hypothetical protein
LHAEQVPNAAGNRHSKTFIGQPRQSSTLLPLLFLQRDIRAHELVRLLSRQSRVQQLID